MSGQSGPEFGGPFASSLMMVPPPPDPASYIAAVAAWRRNYRYLIMGGSNQYAHPTGSDTPFCKINQVALFLLAVEPGMSLLCNGWSPDYDHALGLPSGPATQGSSGGWYRHFASGTVATWTNGTGGAVVWGDHPPPPPSPSPPSPPSPSPPVPPQPPVPSGNHLGCFNDKQGHKLDLPHITPAVYHSAMTAELCNYLCVAEGKFDYFGNQAGHACFCGNSYGSQGAAPASQCNVTCNGNRNEICGGLAHNSVWKTRP